MEHAGGQGEGDGVAQFHQNRVWVKESGTGGCSCWLARQAVGVGGLHHAADASASPASSSGRPLMGCTARLVVW